MRSAHHMPTCVHMHVWHMHVRHMHTFIRELPPPLGLDKKRYPFCNIRETDISTYISKLDGVETLLNPETAAPEVSFYQVLNALTKQVRVPPASTR